MAASKALAAPKEIWDKILPRAALLEKRLEALAEFCDPMLLSEADGFLAGLVLSPEPVFIDEWLPNVLNLEAEKRVEAFLSHSEAMSFVELLLARFNTAGDDMAAGKYWPILDTEHRHSTVSWHLWVSGFSRAMEFRPKSWDTFVFGGELTRNALAGMKRLIAAEKRAGISAKGTRSPLSLLAPGLIPFG